MRKQHRLVLLCKVLRVNRSTYYKHFYSTPSSRSLENNNLKLLILQIYSEYKNILGAYKIRAILQHNYCISISLKRVYKLMNSIQLPSMATKKPKHKPFSNHSIGDNLLSQNFNQSAPNIVWVSDTTFLRAGSKWFYLCVIIDLFSRKVVGYKLSAKHDTYLICDTFNIAVKERNPKSLMFHSDRGCQYTSLPFRQLLDKHNFTQSLSKKGHPYDNAVAESFFKYLKLECTNRTSYRSFNDLYLAIFDYIHLYNSKRPHSTLNYLSPDKFEHLYYSNNSPYVH